MTLLFFFSSLFLYANCCLIRSLTFKLHDRFGFANELVHLLNAASYARQSNRILLIDSSIWNYGNFEDYFETVEPKALRKHLLKAKKQEAFTLPWEVENHICHLKTSRLGRLTRWKSKFSTSFWDKEKRSLAKKYLRLTPFAEKEINKIIMDSGITFDKPDVSLHIRRGDKITEAKLIPLSKYLKAVHKYVKTNNISSKLKNKGRKLRVFVASDDKNIARAIQSQRRTWDVFYIKNTFQLTTTGHDQKTFNRLSAKQRIHEALVFLADMKLLVNSEFLIGAFTSSVSRMAYTLRGEPNSVISLDKRWNPS